jgi:AraC family transcriptional regulator
MPIHAAAAPIDPSCAFAAPGCPAVAATDRAAPQLVVPELSAEIEVTAVRHWPYLSAQLHRKPASIRPVLMQLGEHPQLTVQLAGGMHLGLREQGIRRSYLGQPGTVYLASEQQGPLELDWTSAPHQEIRTLQLDVSNELLQRTAAQAGFDNSRLEWRSAPCIEAPLLQQLGYSLAAALATLGPDDGLYVDTVAHMLAAQLVYHHNAQRHPLPTGQGGLAPLRLRQVQDYIQDTLGHPITLEEMASVACVSPYHFCRLFRQSTGLSPNQYVISQRVRRAQELLQAGGLGVGQVARAVGYQSAEHFARLFRRHTGVLPHALLK